MSKAYNAAAIRTKEVEMNQVLDPLRKPTSDAETQSPCWWDTMPQVPQTAVWSEVVGKKAKNKVPVTTAGDPPGATQKQAVVKRRGARTRTAAIMVNVSNQEDFLELVKKIRGGVNPEVMGEHVVGMRKTKAGRLLIEVKGNTDEVEAVRAEVSKSTVDDIKVRSLQQKSMLEIRDLDQ